MSDLEKAIDSFSGIAIDDNPKLEKIVNTKDGAKAFYQKFKGGQLIDAIVKANNPSLLPKILKAGEHPNEDAKACLEIVRGRLIEKSGEGLLSIYYTLLSTFDCAQYDHIPLLLSLMDPENEGVCSLSLMVIVQYLKINKTRSSTEVKEYLQEEDVDLRQFLSFSKAMELLYPIIPEVIENIFMSKTASFKSRIEEILSHSQTGLYPNQIKVVLAIIKLLNSSCISETARSVNAKEYTELLKLGISVNHPEIRLLSTLTLVKLWNFVKMAKDVSIDKLYDNLVDRIDSEHGIEGLAYLTLNSAVCKKVRADEDLIDKLLSMLGTDKNYGLLVTFSNISKVNLESGDKKTIHYLKNMSTPGDQGQQDDPKVVYLFNKALLKNHQIVARASKLKVHDDNSNLIGVLVAIIFNIAMCPEKEVKQELVKQGALNIIIAYLVKNTTIEKNKTEASEDTNTDVRLNALRALAKILIGVNPATAFNKYDPKSCILFLVELLESDFPLDRFESLLSLTNLATMENLRKMLIAQTFPFLENFILDSTSEQIQIATWELITNLISEPTMLLKFFNIEDDTPDAKKNRQRLILLVKLLNSENEKLQVIIASLIANATSSFEMISMILMKDLEISRELLDIIAAIFSSQKNSDLLLRVAYILLNLTYADATIIRENKQLIASLAAPMKSSKDIAEVLMEVIKELKDVEGREKTEGV